jgi:hypothetical protein
MEKEFVPYELAVKLKQLGFDEPCIATHGYLELYINTDDGHLKAPLYQQAFRWFREKYKLSGLIEIGNQEYSFIVFDEETDSRKITPSMNGTYEEAELICLTKLIEIVEELKKSE